MKKFKYLYFIAAASAFLFYSCSKKNNPTPLAPVVSLKFNDTSFSTTNLTVTSTADTTLIDGQFVANGYITINIPHAKVGSYDLATSGAAIHFADAAGPLYLYTATSGTLVVTALTSTTISGTFAVSAANEAHTNKTITSGQFQANLP
jgi:hypothetical protein